MSLAHEANADTIPSPSFRLSPEMLRALVYVALGVIGAVLFVDAVDKQMYVCDICGAEFDSGMVYALHRAGHDELK